MFERAEHYIGTELRINSVKKVDIDEVNESYGLKSNCRQVLENFNILQKSQRESLWKSWRVSSQMSGRKSPQTRRGVPSWTGLNTQDEEGFFFQKGPPRVGRFTDSFRTWSLKTSSGGICYRRALEGDFIASLSREASQIGAG